MKIAVLVSGNGSNLQAIIDSVESKYLKDVELEIVLADRKCYATTRAEEHGVKHLTLSRKDDAMFDIIDNETAECNLIVLAGFLSIVPSEFCKKHEKKIINLHPALLPKYGGVGMYGDKVHRAVLANNEKETGATVHYVTEGVDEGEVILQASFPLTKSDTIDSIKERLHGVEHQLIVEAIKQISKENV
ncbi:MAG: phosphoribosylglycinamide formyltransferase [Bacteroidales bacterium]